MASTLDISLESTLTGHQNPVFALAQPVHSTVLYTGGNDKGVVEWDLKEMKFKRILCKVGSSVYKLLSIPDSDLLAIGLRSGQLLLVDTQNQSLVANWNTESGAIFDIKLIPSKRELIAIGEEGFAYVWSLDSLELLYRFKVSDTTARVISLSEDGKLLAFGDKLGMIHVHDAYDFHKYLKEPIHDLPVTSLRFINGELISGGRDAKINRLDPKTLEKKQSLVPHMFTVYGIDSSADNNFLVTVSRDKTIKIWRTSDWGLLKNISRDKGIESHHLSINNVLWQDDRIFTVSDDKSIKIWKVETPH